MVDVPYLDHLWDGQKDCLDVGQVRCLHEETSRKLLFWKGDTDDFNAKTKGSDRISTKKSLDRIPSTTLGAEPPRDAKDSGSARSHSTHLETSSSDRP